MKRNYRLIAIADELVIGDRDFVDACLAAEAGGATCIQLRMKNASSSQFLRVSETVVKRVSVPVFINDRVDVAILAGAAGVHFGWDDIAVTEARSIAGAADLRYGVSVGQPEEASRAIGLNVAYWGTGPVFATSNKSDAGKAIGLDGLSRMVALATNTPVVAIGGILAEDCGAILATGASGVAVIGGIFGSGDVEGNTKKLRDALDSTAATG